MLTNYALPGFEEHRKIWLSIKVKSMWLESGPTLILLAHPVCGMDCGLRVWEVQSDARRAILRRTTTYSREKYHEVSIH